MDFQELTWPIRRYFRKVVKIAQWLPVLWKDEDWDYGCLLDLIQFKLLRMAAEISKNDRHTTAQQRAKEMRITAQHIESYKNPSGFKAGVIKQFLFGPEDPVTGCVEWLGSEKEYTSLPFAKHVYDNTTAMEKWHWEQIWERIKKDGQGWWD